MPRRRTTPCFALALMAVLPALAPSRVWADGTAVSPQWKYRLTNISSAPITTPIDFSIIPPGSVIPPARLGPDGQPMVDAATGQTITDNPLIPVDPNGFDPAASFKAYDPKNLTVALGQDKPAGQAGAPSAQSLLLSFGSRIEQGADGQPVFQPILGTDGQPVGGFKPGSDNAIDFRLTLAPSSTAPPTLKPSSSLVSIETITQSVAPESRPPVGGPPGGGTNIPEPLSLLVWSGVAGLGLARARLHRRRQHLAAAA